ncbi:hypothetical protein F5Y04DRAFT_277449 [Hypomontagnella monticulosa]|nr:hypothetical protein F5Y04DRAFT_277449 [Hypomontagnella monticulosa]
MDSHHRVPGLDFSSDTFRSMPNDTQTIHHIFDNQQEVVQDMRPIADSSIPQMMGGGHIKSKHVDLGQHPCMLCHGHQGVNGFSRRDHLVQHLAGYHKVDVDMIKTLISVPVASPTTNGDSNSVQQVRIPCCSDPIPGNFNEATNGHVRQTGLLQNKDTAYSFEYPAYGVMPQLLSSAQFTGNVQYSAGMEPTNDTQTQDDVQFLGGDGLFLPDDAQFQS